MADAGFFLPSEIGIYQGWEIRAYFTNIFTNIGGSIMLLYAALWKILMSMPKKMNIQKHWFYKENQHFQGDLIDDKDIIHMSRQYTNMTAESMINQEFSMLRHMNLHLFCTFWWNNYCGSDMAISSAYARLYFHHFQIII